MKTIRLPKWAERKNKRKNKIKIRHGQEKKENNRKSKDRNIGRTQCQIACFLPLWFMFRVPNWGKWRGRPCIQLCARVFLSPKTYAGDQWPPARVPPPGRIPWAIRRLWFCKVSSSNPSYLPSPREPLLQYQNHTEKWMENSVHNGHSLIFKNQF